MLMENKVPRKAIYVLLFVVILSLSFCVTALSAVPNPQPTDSQLKITTVPNYFYLTDNNENTTGLRDSITIAANENIHSIYIKFWNATPNFTLTVGEKEYEYTQSFLHTFIAIPSDVTECREVTIKFEENVQLSDIYAFKEGELPEWVQIWKEPCEKADMLLFSSFPGDEHSYLSGIIPYYAKVKQYKIQVVSLVNYKSIKNHELLNGLWDAGIQYYPVISDFPYVYSTTENNAITALKNNGIELEDIYEFQTEAIRRFKPLVIIGQDLNGENTKVGQRILLANALTKAIKYAGDAESFPESSKSYGLWTPKKVYIHLYNDKQITLNWDEPSDKLEGLSPFQASQKAFKYHNSLLYSVTSNWLNGIQTKITQASQITDSSPTLFGLYFSSVGNDVNKNDFFENLISYEEQERIEQQKYKEELEKQKEKEEESKRIEESLRLESEAESSREAAKQAKRESERLAAKAAQENNNSSAPLIIAIIMLIASISAVVVILVKRFLNN